MWLAMLWGASAWATPVVERPRRGGLIVGLDLLVHLGPADDHGRFGVAIDGGIQQIWHDRPYYADDFRLEPTPVWQAMATVGWRPRLVRTELTAQVGGLYPMLVADGGYVPGVAAMVGGGVGMATDGFAGLLATGSVLGPLTGARLAASRWQGGWQAPRLTAGVQLPVTCCFYYE
jgi:hypothetical protein